MSLPFLIWLILAGLVGSVWLARTVGVRVVLNRRQVLSSRTYDGPPVPAPRISVLVAARDEEDNIEACAASLLCQDYPDFEVIVIDDRSTDRTPEILRRLRETHAEKLSVVTVTSVRDGWFGKTNAMREGVAVSTGQWLCLTDADCTQTSANTLSTAMRDALAHDSDFLSITPVLEMRTAWERIIQPVCALIMVFWFHPELVNDPRRKVAYANGAFMLLRRSCYDAIGGHAGVRAEFNEDVNMARLAKYMGFRLRMVENSDLYRTRMYTNLREAWRGWSRIFYGCLGTMPRIATAAALVLTFSVLPWISVLASLIGWMAFGSTAGSPWAALALAWACVVVANQLAVRRIYRILGLSSNWSPTYGLGAMFTLGMLLNAMLKATGASVTTWHGTSYRGSRVLHGLDDHERGSAAPMPAMSGVCPELVPAADTPGLARAGAPATNTRD